MQRPVRVGLGDEHGGLPLRFVEVFAPGPDPLAVFDRGSGIVEAGAEQLLNGVGHASHVKRQRVRPAP